MAQLPPDCCCLTAPVSCPCLSLPVLPSGAGPESSTPASASKRHSPTSCEWAWARTGARAVNRVGTRWGLGFRLGPFAGRLCLLGGLLLRPFLCGAVVLRGACALAFTKARQTRVAAQARQGQANSHRLAIRHAGRQACRSSGIHHHLVMHTLYLSHQLGRPVVTL